MAVNSLQKIAAPLSAQIPNADGRHARFGFSQACQYMEKHTRSNSNP